MPDSRLRILSVIAPMTQLNTPYPSTAYLTGFLRSRGFDALQEDLALALVLRLLSRDGLKAMRSHAEALPAPRRSESVAGFLEHFERYLATIEPTIAFLQGRDSTLAHRICSGAFSARGAAFRHPRCLCRPGWWRPTGLGLRRARGA